jgi:hypothetical protein
MQKQLKIVLVFVIACSTSAILATISEAEMKKVKQEAAAAKFCADFVIQESFPSSYEMQTYDLRTEYEYKNGRYHPVLKMVERPPQRLGILSKEETKNNR